MTRLIFNLVNISILKKRILFFLFDTFICIISFYFSYFLRLDIFFINETNNQILSFVISYIYFFFLCFFFKAYRSLSRYYDLNNIFFIAKIFFFYSILLTLTFHFIEIHGVPRSIGILHPIIFFIIFIISRISIFLILKKIENKPSKKNIIVYSNSSSFEDIKNTFNNYNIKLFLTHDDNFQNRLIGSIPIKTIDSINKTFKIKNIDTAFVEKNLYNKDSDKKLKIIFGKKIKIKLISKIENILDHEFREDLNDFKISEKTIKYSVKKLKSRFNKSTVLITGAGGSIGSELSKQIYKLQPNKIILVENSEFNLYRLLNDLEVLVDIKKTILIKYYLISANDSNKLNRIFIEHSPNFIFHCAAFKHVILVEKNIIEAIENNYFSTKILCELAIKHKVSNFVLISSDKAVNPSSIMGATKRLSELAIKYYAKKINLSKNKTHFSAVRFANVLNSSGSVVPLFAKQILSGGPITITDKNVERYFMTIIDAVRLVLETIIISKNGDILLLDMGKQIKILHVAKKLAQFYGQSIKDDENPNGNISVVEIGLKQGEKIKEQLYYGIKRKTKNKDILCVDDYDLNVKNFLKLDKNIRNHVRKNNNSKLKNILLNINTF